MDRRGDWLLPDYVCIRKQANMMLQVGQNRSASVQVYSLLFPFSKWQKPFNCMFMLLYVCTCVCVIFPSARHFRQITKGHSLTCVSMSWQYTSLYYLYSRTGKPK